VGVLPSVLVVWDRVVNRSRLAEWLDTGPGEGTAQGPTAEGGPDDGPIAPEDD
jgi:hypothetical protein